MDGLKFKNMITAKDFLATYRIYEFDDIYNSVGDTFPLINLMEHYANVCAGKKIESCISIANDASIDRDCLEFNFNKLKA